MLEGAKTEALGAGFPWQKRPDFVAGLCKARGCGAVAARLRSMRLPRSRGLNSRRPFELSRGFGFRGLMSRGASVRGARRGARGAGRGKEPAGRAGLGFRGSGRKSPGRKG